MGSARGALEVVPDVRPTPQCTCPAAPEPATERRARAMSDVAERGRQAFLPAEQAAMRRALQIAQTPGVPLGPNPRVGCVLLDEAGLQVAEGFHRGAGQPHAEIEALQA